MTAALHVMPEAAARPIASIVEPGFEDRWVAWVERGRRHDVAVGRKMRAASLAGAVIAVLIAAWRLAGGSV